MNNHKNIMEEDCPFCNIGEHVEVLFKADTAMAILDSFPISPGHALVIPKRHVADYFELTAEEQNELWQLVNRCKMILQDRFHPDGFNIGINVGEMAGQSIFHVHIHLIPRYKGDMKNPKGGVRHIIPGKGYY
ncbi:MAG: HIT family protein [Synergistaceae bacterium]|nr:HIT family protein [Synergistaceae bacterium]MDD3946041.1 HIT family protein [Bacteroidales bacterium]